MKVHLIIKESLRYLNRWKRMPIGIFISPCVVEDAKYLPVLPDIALLREAGFQFFMFLPPEGEQYIADIQQALPAVEAVVSTGDIRIAWSKGRLPLVYSGVTDFFQAVRQLSAYKLVFVEPWAGLFCHLQDPERKDLVRQMTYDQLRSALQQEDFSGEIEAIIEKILRLPRVCRVHFVNGKQEGSLLQELLTCEGDGTLIHDAHAYHSIRQADSAQDDDVISVIDAGYARHEIGVELHPEKVIERIAAGECLVLSIDGHVHACGLYRSQPAEQCVRIEYLCGLLPYRQDEGFIKELFAALMERYMTEHVGLPIIMELAKNTVWLGMSPWFKQYGFTLCQNHREVCDIAKARDVTFPVWILGGQKP